MHSHPSRAVFLFAALLLTLPTPAATPEEEARFTDAARKAFADRDPAGLANLTLWDDISDSRRRETEHTYAALTDEKSVTFEVALADANPNIAGRDQTVAGVPHRSNVDVTKQLSLTMRSADKRILGIINFPVGEKNGKLYFAVFTPVK